MYKYFVSYFYNGGHGNGVLTLDHKIDSLHMIRKTERELEKLSPDVGKIGILNFILLETKPN